MIRGTGGVAGAALVCFVTGDIVLAVVDTIADLCHRYTTLVCAGELTSSAGSVGTAFFVRTVLTVVLVIALPRLENAATIVATEFVRAARMVSCVTRRVIIFRFSVNKTLIVLYFSPLTAVVGVLIGTITAIAVTIAGPHLGDALAIAAGKLARVAGNVFSNAHAILVD